MAHGGQYIAAYVFSLILSALPLFLVQEHGYSNTHLLFVVIAAAAAMTIIQGYFWLRLDVSRTQAWFTASFILFIPLVVLTIGLTAWMFATLYTRTMIPTLMHAPGFTH